MSSPLPGQRLQPSLHVITKPRIAALRTPTLSAITPGEVLLEDWMKPNGLSGNELCRRTGIPASRLTETIKGQRGITADTALRLGRFFGTGRRFWLNLQQARDIELDRVAATLPKRFPAAVADAIFAGARRSAQILESEL